jgi:hypothetical protein
VISAAMMVVYYVLVGPPRRATAQSGLLGPRQLAAVRPAHLCHLTSNQ